MKTQFLYRDKRSLTLALKPEDKARIKKMELACAEQQAASQREAPGSSGAEPPGQQRARCLSRSVCEEINVACDVS